MLDITEEDKECVFCKSGKDEIMIKDDKGTRIKYTRITLQEEYLQLLRKLKDSKAISDLVSKKEVSRIIKPGE